MKKIINDSVIVPSFTQESLACAIIARGTPDGVGVALFKGLKREYMPRAEKFLEMCAQDTVSA